MIYLIVAINFSITLLNIYIAIRIWQLGLLVARIDTIVVKYERYFALVLKATPIVIDRGQDNVHQARQRYRLLQLQISKIRQLILLVNWSYTAWRKI